MRSSQDMINDLESLVQLDLDAIAAYEQAIGEVDHPDVKSRLEDFKRDHELHVENLSSAIIAQGGSPPKRSPDVKGFFLKTFTQVRSASGTPGALRAMKMNEELTNHRYSTLFDQDWPVELRDQIEANYLDEQRHLSYISEAIEMRLWEQTGGKAA